TTDKLSLFPRSFPRVMGTEAEVPSQPQIRSPKRRGPSGRWLNRPRRIAMRCQLLSRSLVLFAISLSVLAVISLQNSVPIASAKSGETSGSLQVVDSSGKPKALCPLKHTEVKAEITGFISRVLVTQE